MSLAIVPKQSHAPTLAEHVVAAVVPSRSPAAVVVAPPLPVGKLGGVLRDGSMHYRIATLDHRGRAADASIVRALDWHPGIRLDIQAVSETIVIRAHAEGLFTLARRGHIPIPAAIRHWCSLATGDRVLLAAAPDLGVLIVHTPAALDAMVLAYHRLLAEKEDSHD
jgi:hypothetical protein